MAEPLTYEQLKDALCGFYAYETGSIDSGLHDPDLKSRVSAHLKSLDETAIRILMSTVARDLFLTDEAMKEGYGFEDVAAFHEWFEWAGLT